MKTCPELTRMSRVYPELIGICVPRVRGCLEPGYTRERGFGLGTSLSCVTFGRSQGMLRLGSSPLALDWAHYGFTTLIRSYVRLEPILLVYGMLRSGSAKAKPILGRTTGLFL